MITVDGNLLVLNTPYNPGLVQDLKMFIPSEGRRWDKDKKVWLIDPAYGKELKRLVKQYFGEDVKLPKIKTSTDQVQRIFELRYLGACKPRGGDEPSAFGLVDGEWSVIFPESVLKDWFGAMGNNTVDTSTLYAALGVKKDASEDEIKAGFRRMARQWHPDVCKEPDAQEQFIKIKNAFDLLSDPGKRARYDAGLALMAFSRVDNQVQDFAQFYRSPLRCGLIMAEGVKQVGRFMVKKIMVWQDITNNKGQVLVTSWPAGATKHVEAWA